jgi:hypothetical protein
MKLQELVKKFLWFKIKTHKNSNNLASYGFLSKF